MKPSKEAIAYQVATSLAEDVGTGDVSAQLIDSDAQAQATIYCREQAVLCGIDWFNQAFLQLDGKCTIDWSVQDGDQLEPNQKICLLTGSARALLSAERTALNFLQTLSGVASKSAQIARLIVLSNDRASDSSNNRANDKASNKAEEETKKQTATQVRILDTRKTIPGLRLAQKYAVSVGGCDNHRIGLYDAFLIKENHIASSRSIADALQKARTINPNLLIEIEVETLDQLKQAIAAGADRIMLDNFNLDDVRKAVELTQSRVELEVSGNLDQAQLPDLIATGIDYISIGALTKHVRAVDFSMRFQQTEKP